MVDTLYRIGYEFCFQNEEKIEFTILLDPKTISLIRPENNINPDWSKLTYNQCSCCPYTEDDFTHCPVAVNIAEIVETFKNMISSDVCTVYCKTPERTYMKETSVMEGLSSILGIIMATSECQMMDFFKPMARFHLPFSTVDETIVRATSLYLLRQYFEHKSDKIPDLDLKELDRHYEDIKYVNEGILARINAVVKKDADKNAIVVLDSLAQVISMEIDYNLNSLEYLFTSGK